LRQQSDQHLRGLGGGRLLKQGLQHGVGIGPPQTAGEQQVLPANHQRANDILGPVVNDLDVAIIEESREWWP